MSNIKWFTSAFEKIDDKKDIKVIESIDQINFKEYILSNARVTSSSFKILKKYLGTTRFSYENLDGTAKISVKISKIKMPTKNYPILPYLISNIESLKQNGKNFLGVGDFGEEFLDFRDLIHMGVFGASGYGKSSLIRFLLTQNLIFAQDCLNILLDFKGNEFKSFNNLNHPNILAHIHGLSEMKHFSDYIGMELAKREYYFSNAFEVAPTNLAEYKKLREQYPDNSLPEFSQIFIWIDEGKGFQDAMAQIGMEAHNIEKFINRCRSFGLNFIFSSQNSSDFGGVNCRNLSHIVTFYSPSDYRTSDMMADITDRNKYNSQELYGRNVDMPIPGRITLLDVRNSSAKFIQVPELTSQECLDLINEYSNFGISQDALLSLNEIDPALFGSLDVMRYLSENHTYEDLMKYEFLRGKRFSVTYLNFLTFNSNGTRISESVKNIWVGSESNPFFKCYKFTPMMVNSEEISLDEQNSENKNTLQKINGGTESSDFAFLDDFFKKDEETKTIQEQPVVTNESILEIRTRLKKKIAEGEY